MKEKIRIFVCNKCCNTAYTTDGSIPGACTSQYWVRTSGICGGHYSEIEGADFDWVVNQEVEKRIKERIKNLPRYDIVEYDGGMCRHMDGDWLNFEEVRSSLSQKEGGAK